MATLLDLPRAAIDLVLPPRCPGCGTIVAGDHRFCAACWAALDFLGDPACEGCGAPLAHGGEDCGACDGRRHLFVHARAAVAYGPIASAVALRLKYGRRPGVAGTMAAAMARLLRDAGDDALLVPVPLHRWRLWARGYNQAALIAAALGRVAGLPCRADLLVRTRATPVLRGLGRGERRRAVADAFAARGRVDGRAVVLVDDVFTTGATAEACAGVLLAAGAREVRLVTWARVLPPVDKPDARPHLPLP